MSKRLGDFFAASASVKQKKPVHCLTMIPRKLNDKNADIHCHVVLPPACKAGGDSQPVRNCVSKPFTFSAMKLLATGSRDRCVERWSEGS